MCFDSSLHRTAHATVASISHSDAPPQPMFLASGDNQGCCDWMLCCFGCLTLSGFRTRITQLLVFFPPRPALYEIENKTSAADGESKATQVYLHPLSSFLLSGRTSSHSIHHPLGFPQIAWFLDPDNNYKRCEPYSSSCFRYQRIPTSLGSNIATFWIRNPAPGRKYVRLPSQTFVC